MPSKDDGARRPPITRQKRPRPVRDVKKRGGVTPYYLLPNGVRKQRRQANW